jgi:hypothetical protein
MAQEPRPADEAFAERPSAGTSAERSFNPNMLGDFLSCRYIFVPPDPHDNGHFDGDEAIRFCIPDLVRGAFKIADNESPRPQDRVYINYNYFRIDSGASQITPVDLNREVLGVEKTCLDGTASFGVRLPFFQASTSSAIPGSPGAQAVADAINHEELGDLTFIGKYALFVDKQTGDVLSVGLAVTVPTGPSSRIAIPAFASDGSVSGISKTETLHPTLLQPYVGAVFSGDNCYVHGFSAIAVPTDSQDITYFFNDIGVGYFIYRCSDPNALLSSVVPTFETHINTPLNHRGSGSVPIGAIDIVDLTAGTTFGMSSFATLTLGVVTPVTGPRPFDIEGQVQLNMKF